jgi:hypothetical protein
VRELSESTVPEDVFVQVVETDGGREIAWGANVTERLRDRLDELRAAVVAGAQVVNADLDQLPERPHWRVSELSATFGVTLTADAGVLLSRAGAEATFEVTVTFSRT